MCGKSHCTTNHNVGGGGGDGGNPPGNIDSTKYDIILDIGGQRYMVREMTDYERNVQLKLYTDRMFPKLGKLADEILILVGDNIGPIFAGDKILVTFYDIRMFTDDYIGLQEELTHYAQYLRYGSQFPSYGKPGCSNINLEARVLRDLTLLLNGSSSTEIFSKVDYKQIVANDKDTQEWYLAGLTSIITNNDWSAFEGEGYDRLLQQFRNNNDRYDFPSDPRFANFDTTKSLMH